MGGTYGKYDAYDYEDTPADQGARAAMAEYQNIVFGKRKGRR